MTYTPEIVGELRALVKDCDTWGEARDRIAAHMGIEKDNVTKMNRKYGFWGEPKVVAQIDSAILKATTSDAFSVDVETSKAATLDEVIALCKVDTETWESKGFNVRRGAKGFAWSARFSRKKAIVDVESLVQGFVTRATAHSPTKWITEKVSSKGEANCLLVLNIQDLHLAKLATKTETGHADWDIKIAEKAYRDTVDELIAKAPASRIEEVVVIVGSDMLQVDTDQSTTTAGTYVDSDSRLSKAFDTAAHMLADVIEKLAARFRVRVVVIPGNHDAVTSHVLGRYVEAWFRTHPNVSIDAAPRSRKYVGYGKVLIAFDHGDGTKLKDLPLVVMRENQSTISQYQHIEVLSGHTHAEASEDTKGIVVRVAPALCAPDAWHSDKGYIGTVRRSQALLYHRDNGLEAIYYSRALE